MTGSVLDFDDVAADDALIESIRSGAGIDDVPADDPAASLLVAMRDGADAPDVSAPAVRGVPGVPHRRRLVASGVAACFLVVAGVGAAVAGDPGAAFTYVFRQGVDLGSRFGSPAGDDHAQAPIGGGVESTRLAGSGGPPVRQGSAAAPWLDHGVREPFGYEHQPRDWDGTVPSEVGSFDGDDRSTSDKLDTFDEDHPSESAPTLSPETDDPTSPPDHDSYGPQSEGPQSETPPDESESPQTYGPTETETEPAPTEPTTPSESSPTPTPTPSPSESESTEPTEPEPTESTEPSPTSSPTSSPTETGTPSTTTPSSTESAPTP